MAPVTPGHDSTHAIAIALTVVSWRAATGFSGSELAQAVSAALYSAFGSGGDLTTELIEREILATRPLSVTMHERVQALRDWARERTVPVD